MYLLKSHACFSDVPSNKNSGIYVTDDISEVDKTIKYVVIKLLGEFRANSNSKKYRTVIGVRKAHTEKRTAQD